MGGAGGQALRGGGRMAAWRTHAYTRGGGGGELRLEAARVPAVRAPDHVLVRVLAASINPLDVAMLDGYGSRILNVLRAADGAEGEEFPLVAGRDFAGVVERAGPAARLRPGDRVWGVVPPHWQGAHADYVLVKDQWAGLAPSTLDDMSAGGALYAALSACAALRAAGLRPGGARAGVGAAAGAGRDRPPRVLLLGLGGVGHAALQLLVNNGAEVVVGCAGEVCARARALGAAAALDRHAAGYDAALQRHGPYKAIVDCAGVGGREAGARGWRFSRYATLTTPLLRETDARGLLAGTAAAAAQLLAQSVSAAASARASAPAACARASPPAACARASPPPACAPPHVRWAYFSPRAADIEHLRRLAERNKFVVQVERVFPWWEGAAAYERAAQGGARGKLLLDFTAPAPAAPPAPHHQRA